MQIPLDYYRILGLPIQTSAEQLQQAYRDRTIQLPRREYSETAIAARKQLLEQAYMVLSDPQHRSGYDANYFAYAYDSEDDHSATTAERPNLIESVASSLATHTPSIEIPNELFVGALLILQELGEYELVLNLAPSQLSDRSNADQSGQRSNLNIRADIVLTLALAYLELGREQWQQGQYENAATSLENGQNLLLHEGLFPNIRNEIQADLDKLRPYRILELLAQPEKNVAERSLGLKLFQDLLQQRGGIDGTGDDGSGLSLDDFLRFIQQLRSYLTAAEQRNLFAADQHPSAVATYLIVYALIAQGFAQRQPSLIREAKLLLMSLEKRQDVHLEQAVCSLLLGQTAEASRNLELSQEYETLVFIRENSQGSPDLLPGLCLYSERWLQTEVFPQFRDLEPQVSLKDYFANKRVQAYLEALPTQETAIKKKVVAPESLTSTQTASHDKKQAPHAAENLSLGASSVAIVPTIERTRITTTQNRIASPNATIAQPPQRSRRRNLSRDIDVYQTGEARSPRHSTNRTFRNIPRNKKTRLMLLAVAGVLGIVVLAFLVSQTSALLRQILFPAPLQEELMVQLNQPPLAIPSPGSVLTAEPLNQETAKQLIHNWLSTKTAAFGSNHAVDRLEQVLVEPALSQWQLRVQNDKIANQYRQYKHSFKVESVQSETAPDQAHVEATVNEIAQVYRNSRLNKNASYDDNLRVRYDLVRKNGEWRIREMTVLR
jgi:hypothetical protein